ncbi:MAG: cytochrome c3 family protein [Anaerolineae bacterium]|nr:cytochrome c3 family protein [Anaerolineae bacterium]
MAPLEPWEKVLVDGETYPETVHGQIACVDCHGGDDSAENKNDAHADMIRDPSADPEVGCGECHPDVTAVSATSLHSTLNGYWNALDQRSVPENHEALSEMFGNHCASCHATCGDCHVSQPDSVGSGFIEGHNFNATPSMTRNCTACHGSRVGNEYLGKNSAEDLELRPDVHFRQGRMTCVDCHTSHEMHGQTDDCQNCHDGPEAMAVAPPEHRYDGVQSPRCETCHQTVATGQDDVEMHAVHGADLSCQVCHSVAYTSCDNCHVELSVETGNPKFSTDGAYLTFLIGRNPLKSFDRPYDFVTVRHIPIADDSYSFYGDDLLPNFHERATWAYATPHNIQLETPQAASCDSCHGNVDLFLTADKIAAEELEANHDLIIDVIPPPIAAIQSPVAITTTETISPTVESP